MSPEPTGEPPPRLVEGGPAVVAIGGGHGVARSLGAIRRYAGAITAVVSVADDGGSSGRLRRSLGIPAPGDIRRCLVALTPRPSLLADLLEYRFDAGELDGHALGNLVLAALQATTGDFVSATRAAGELLGALGVVLPSASAPVELRAPSPSGELTGQVQIMESSGLSRVTLDPPGVRAPESVLEAIMSAEQIVVGPGSLYTSVLAALAPEGIADAMAATSARRIYVCNLREQVPETSGYDVAAHVEALLRHGVTPDVVLCDSTAMKVGDVAQTVLVEDVPLAARQPLVHDEELLAAALSALR